MFGRGSAAAVCLLALLTGCTEEAEPTGRGAGVERVDVPELAVAWRAPAPRGGAWADLDDARADALWPAADAVSVVSDRAVTTYDAATGEVRSTVDLGGPVCAASRDLNAAGVGAVLLGPLEDCRTVVAVDTVTGTVRWRSRITVDTRLGDVSVGDEVVAVTDVRGAHRLRLRDGRALRRLDGGEAASNGRYVVVTPERGGGAESYDVHDQDTGRLVRSVPTEPDSAVEVLVGSDPLVATGYAWRDDGTYLRDLSGRTPRRIGRETNAGYPHLAQHVETGDFVAVQYGASPVVEVWPTGAPAVPRPLTLAPEELLVDDHAGRLVTLTPAADEVDDDTAVVRAVDPADPADPLVLGTAEADRTAVLLGTRTAAVVGDLLVSPVEDEVVAVRLPAEGVPTSDLLAGSGLADGELGPAAGGDLCAAVPPATLRALGFARSGLPVEADCRLHQVRPREVTLGVTSWAVQPSWADQLTGTEGAERDYRTVLLGDERFDLPDLDRVDGLGDAAAVGADPTEGAGLLLRVANVVVVVERPAGPAGLTAAEERALLVRVGRELVAEIERRRGGGG